MTPKKENVTIEVQRLAPTTLPRDVLAVIANGNHIVEKYAAHFASWRTDFGSNEISAVLDWHHQALVQCIGYALSTDTGYGVLYTHNSMLAIEIVPTEFRNNTSGTNLRVRVNMSKLYKCNAEGTSTLHALLALLRMSKEHGTDNKREKLKKLRKQIDLLRVTSTAGVNRMRYVRPRRSGSGQGSTTDGTSRTSRTPGNESGHASRREGRAHANPQCRLDEISDEDTETIVFGYEYIEERSEEAEMVRQAMVTGSLLELCQADVDRLFASHWTGQTSVGAFGYAIGARVAGVDVMIKRWNWKHAEGINHLEHEMRVYGTMRERNPELLGIVMPRLFAVVKEPREDLALVLEHVGSKIELKCEQERKMGSEKAKEQVVRYVDGVKLKERDEKEINEAATESIRKLWRCGISHDDLRDPNLRVARVARETNESKGWCAWWIDFGRAEIYDVDDVQTGVLGRRLEKGAVWKLGYEGWHFVE